jgi:flagellar motility protein MotE (MotC chaperone)
MKNGDRRSKTVLWVGLALLGPSAFALAQSQSQPAQSSSSSQSQPQSQPQQRDDAAADAAKKPQKDKPKAKKVYTEEDLSGLRGNGVSVVGDANAPARSNAPASRSSGGDATKSVRDEEYWRGRASQIKEQMAATDEAIKNLQAEIKKNGATGFDAQTGLKDNVIYVDDRNARLKQLEQRRQDLDKQMDLLQEEGRKAGADSAWFR